MGLFVLVLVGIVDERSQGAIEYLLMLSAALVVVSGIILSIQRSTAGLEEGVSGRMENVKDTVVNILT